MKWVSLVPEDADFEEQKRVFSGKTEEFKARLKAGETLDDIYLKPMPL